MKRVLVSAGVFECRAFLTLAIAQRDDLAAKAVQAGSEFRDVTAAAGLTFTNVNSGAFELELLTREKDLRTPEAAR